MSKPSLGDTERLGDVYTFALLVAQLGDDGALGFQQKLLGCVPEDCFASWRAATPANHEKPWVKRRSYLQDLVRNIPDSSSRFESLQHGRIDSFFDEVSGESFRTLHLLPQRVVLEPRNILQGLPVRVEIFLWDNMHRDKGIIIRHRKISSDFSDNAGPLILIDSSKDWHALIIQSLSQVDLPTYHPYGQLLTALVPLPDNGNSHSVGTDTDQEGDGDE